jgi:hypothetical protein
MQQTAAALGLSSSAVKSRVVRARSRLRKLLGNLFLARAASRPESHEHTGDATAKRLSAATERPLSFADAAA